MPGIFNDVKNWLENTLNNILAWVLQLLPNSPFRVELPEELRKILGYVNWVIPFEMIVNTLLLWLTAVVAFYLYKVILRWTKAI